MKCIFLGTGYSIPTPRRHNTSLFLQKGDGGLLIDCNGACAQRLTAAGFPIENIAHIFLTHEHLDHIGATVNLINQVWLKSAFYGTENRRTVPINVYANERTLRIIQTVFDAYGHAGYPYMFPLNLHPLPESGGKLSVAGIDLEYFPVKHNITPCFGIETRTGKGGLVYSADTEPHPELYARLRDGDIFIHECNMVDVPVSHGHTTLAQIEEIFPSLPQVTIYLVHLPHISDEKDAALQMLLKQKYNNRIVLPEDGLMIDA